MEETSANPHHRVFLTPRVCNYETYTLHASHPGKNVWENHVLAMWREKNPLGGIFREDETEGEHRNRWVHLLLLMSSRHFTAVGGRLHSGGMLE